MHLFIVGAKIPYLDLFKIINALFFEFNLAYIIVNHAFYPDLCLFCTKLILLNNYRIIMKLLKVLAISLISFSVCAQSLKTPTPSPLQKISQEFALSTIDVEYSRPSAKGRKVFGDLEKYGNVWRTGANSPTTFTFGEDVSVGGKALKAGKYVLLTIPGKDSWQVMFCKPTASSFTFKEEDVVVKFSVKPNEMPFAFETFMIAFGEQTASSVKVSLLWENTDVEFEITANIDQKVMDAIDKAMNVDSKPYHAAASYYYDNNKDMKKALEWATKAADAQPHAFWITHLKAKIQAKLGDKAGAVASANKSIEVAKKAGNDGYVDLNEKLIKSLK